MRVGIRLVGRDRPFELLLGGGDRGRPNLLAGAGRGGEQEPSAVGERLGVIGTLVQHPLVELLSLQRIDAEQRPRLGQQRRHVGRGRAAGDLLAAEPLARRAGHQPSRPRADRHHRGDDRQPPPPVARRRRRQTGAALLDRPQHVGRPLGVAVAQRGVVLRVDVAGGVLGVEVAQRPQQEAPLVLELGQPVGVHHAGHGVSHRRHREGGGDERAVVVGRVVGAGTGPAPAPERDDETGGRAHQRRHRERPHEGVEP